MLASVYSRGEGVTFMDAHVSANAMSSAMHVLQAEGPEGASCKGIDGDSRRVVWEDRGSHCDVTLEDLREACFLKIGWSAQVERASDVSRAAVVLAA